MNAAPMPRSGRPRRARRAPIAALLALLLAGALLVAARQVALGAQAYVFGLPLVITDLTRAHAVRTLAPENQLARARRFPDRHFRAVVRPNVDTLYTSAFIDAAQGPWVFEMAPNDQRYEVMSFMDAWTNVFAAPGTRTIGTGGGRFLLASRTWQGPVPQGMTLLRAPTDRVWLIGRTQTNGSADYPTVHRLQDGIRLGRLPAAGAAPVEAAPAPVPMPVGPGAAPGRGTAPLAQLREMPVQEFFARLARLMVDNPPSAADAPMLAQLARLGVAPGAAPRWGAAQRWAMALGRAIAERTMARELDRRPTRRGWITPPAMLGDYGTSYAIRAVVAVIGLGANLPADTLYPSARVDGRGEALHGDHRYRLHFERGALPPVHAFWSVTAYGPDDFFIDNALDRYALGDRDPLVPNPDGSLDLLIQAQAPPGRSAANWLPVKAGSAFTLTARLYWPGAAALDGRWGMPAVQRID